MEFDKTPFQHLLGKRITAVAIKHRKPESVERSPLTRLFLMFDDGTGYEMFCNGWIMPCKKPESFDLHRLIQRGSEAYNNEYLAINNPDGKGHLVLINRPYVLED